MSLLTGSFITQALTGRGLVSVQGQFSGADDIAIDSRRVAAGSLFVPLKGEKTDGHHFIPQALEKGASGVLVSKQWASQNHSVPDQYLKTAFFVVEEPLAALQTLAETWRLSMEDVVVVGITGSNGKTTTKEILAAILHEEGNAVWNPGNLNSEIGLPLSVFAIRREHRFAVLEMGMNRVGEMDILARVARPDVAVVTNIGTAHIGPMGSQQAIADEKKKIFSRFTGHETAVIPANTPWTAFLAEGVPGKVVTWDPHRMEGLSEAEPEGLSGWNLTLYGKSVLFSLPGMHNLSNMVAAVTAARVLGVSEESILGGVAAVRPEFGRSEVLSGRVTLIRDCYNANPDSLKASLEMLASLEGRGRRFAVLADMRELGEGSEEAHQEAGRAVAALVEEGCIDRVLFYGEQMRLAWQSAGGTGAVEWHGDYTALKERVLSLVREGDFVLLKGSRGMELERLTDPLLLSS